MDNIEKLKSRLGKADLASSYLVFTEQDRKEEVVELFLSSLNPSNEDVTKLSSSESDSKKDIVNIKQVRQLLRDMSIYPSKNVRLAVIYDADKMNREAANALLKVLEEPPSYGTFLLLSETDQLLPTIKSRCKMVDLRSSLLEGEGEFDFDDLLGKPFVKLSKEIDKIIKKNKELSFLGQLLLHIRKKMLKAKDRASVDFLRDIEKAKKDIEMNANKKLTLECLLLNNRKNI